MPVNSQHPDYDSAKDKWQRCRDAAAGGDAVHKAAERYLPKLKEQPAHDYAIYVMRATFYNASWRTISGLIGMVFRKPAVVEAPATVLPMLDNVDGAGQPYQLFVQAVLENALVTGRVGVLVDHPEAPEGASLADAQVMNLRPTMQIYRPESIINWRMGMVNNESVLVMVVLKECEQVKDDEFTYHDEDRWRVLDLVDAVADENGAAGKRYRVRLYKQKNTSAPINAKLTQADFEQVGSDIFPRMNSNPMPYIPFVIMGTDDVSSKVDDPPLIDLVDLNLSHYRTNAIYEQCIAFCPPTMLLVGYKPENEGDKVYVGSGTAIISPDPETDGKYIEYAGSGLGPLEKALDRKEAQMAVLGARMLEPQKAGVEATDTVAMHRKGEESLLSSMAQAVSLGCTKALRWFCDWAQAPSDKASVELNRDFYPAGMTSQMLTALISAWQQGAPGFSDQGLFEALKRGEMIPQDTDLEEEQARIKARQQELMASMPDPGTAPDEGAPA